MLGLKDTIYVWLVAVSKPWNQTMLGLKAAPIPVTKPTSQLEIRPCWDWKVIPCWVLRAGRLLEIRPCWDWKVHSIRARCLDCNLEIRPCWDWKPVKGFNQSILSILKSDHVGIERKNQRGVPSCTRSLKSDHVGIESFQQGLHLTYVCVLKSDHVGIESWHIRKPCSVTLGKCRPLHHLHRGGELHPRVQMASSLACSCSHLVRFLLIFDRTWEKPVGDIVKEDGKDTAGWRAKRLNTKVEITVIILTSVGYWGAESRWKPWNKGFLLSPCYYACW